MATPYLSPAGPLESAAQYQAHRRYQVRKAILNMLKHGMILLVGMFFFLPLLWMVATSFKSDQDVFHIPMRLLPYVNSTTVVNGQELPLYDVTFDNQVRRLALVSFDASIGQFVDPANPSLIFPDVRMKNATQVMEVGFRVQNYTDALTRNVRAGTGVTFVTYLINSLVICLFAIIGTVSSNALVAYGFTFVEFPGRDVLFVLVLATIMLPFQAIMIPQYIFFNDFLHWGNSNLPLIVPTYFANAWDIFLLRQFYRTIPKEMSDAARIDGASEFAIFFQVVIPLVMPALAVVTITTFLYHWNDFQAPLLYLTSPQNFTMALGLQDFQGQRQILWNLLMAASVVFTMPIVIAFFFAQKTFIQGIKLTGLKE